MKRFDLTLLVALSCLAAFVGVQARDTRVVSVEREGHGEAAAVATAKGTRIAFGDSSTSRRPITIRTSAARNTLGPEDVLRRVRERSTGTFINDVIVAHDSALARWPDRLVNPLRVWVQNGASLEDWSEERNSIVRRAFTDWSETGLPISFSFVFDSAAADVHVTWTDRFNESISGKTLWAHDEEWWIIDANIQLAVRHHSGEILDTTSVRAIAMHEVGHLLGLDHTTDTTSIMAPKVRVRDLSAADRATAQLLYKLPAGRIAEGPAPRRRAAVADQR